MLRSKKEVDRHVKEIFGKMMSDTDANRNLKGYNVAKLYFNIKEYSSAKRYLAEFLSVRPKSAEGHKLLGQIYEDQNEKKKAIQSYKTSYEIMSSQKELVLKICDLYAQVEEDFNVVMHWIDIGEKLYPQHENIAMLRHVILARNNGQSKEEMEKMYLGEIRKIPTNVNFHLDLLKFYLEWSAEKPEILKDAYHYILSLEPKEPFPNSFEWYSRNLEVLEAYEKIVGSLLDRRYDVFYLLILDRLIATSFMNGTISRFDSNYSQSDALLHLSSFDAKVNKALIKYGENSYLKHLICQNYFYFACHLSKLGQKQVQANFNNVPTMVGSLLFLSLHEAEIEESEIGFDNLKNAVIHRKIRICQAGHIVNHLAGIEKMKFLKRCRELASSNGTRQYICNMLFDHKSLPTGGYFLSNNSFSDTSFKYPSYELLFNCGKVVMSSCQYNLHLVLWLMMQYTSKQDALKRYDLIKPSISNALPFSAMLSVGTAETLCRLDILAFLESLLFCFVSNNVDEFKAIAGQFPSLVSTITTSEQYEWWTAVVSISINSGHYRLNRLQSVLQKGMASIRIIGSNCPPVPLIVYLAKYFSECARNLQECEMRTVVEALEERAEHYWLQVVHQCKKVVQSAFISSPKSKLFILKKSDITFEEANEFIRQGKMYLEERMNSKCKKSDAMQALGISASVSLCEKMNWPLTPSEAAEEEYIEPSEASFHINPVIGGQIPASMSVPRNSSTPYKDYSTPILRRHPEHKMSPDRSDAQVKMLMDMQHKTVKALEEQNAQVRAQSDMILSMSQSRVQDLKETLGYYRNMVQDQSNSNNVAPMQSQISALDSRLKDLQIEVRGIATEISELRALRVLEREEKYKREEPVERPSPLDVSNAVQPNMMNYLNYYTRPPAPGALIASGLFSGAIPSFNPPVSLPAAAYPSNMPSMKPHISPASVHPHMKMAAQQMVSTSIPLPSTMRTAVHHSPGIPPSATHPFQIPMPEYIDSYNVPTSLMGDPRLPPELLADAIVTPGMKNFIPQRGYDSGNVSWKKEHAKIDSTLYMTPNATATNEAPPPISEFNAEYEASTETSYEDTDAEDLTLSEEPKPSISISAVPIGKIEPSIRDLLKPSVFSGFSIEAIGNSGSTFSFGAKPQPQTAESTTASNPPSLFFEAPNTTRDDNDSRDDSVAEFEPNIEFEPVIDLPQLINVETGEENEEKVFGERSKLYRYDRDTREMKERGKGEMKILKNNVTGKYRIVMRQEQTLKMCANHVLTEDMKLKPNEMAENAYLWNANDYADEELKLEQLCVRFKDKKVAEKFKSIFDTAVESCVSTATPPQPEVVSKPKDVTAVSSVPAPAPIVPFAPLSVDPPKSVSSIFGGGFSIESISNTGSTFQFGVKAAPQTTVSAVTITPVVGTLDLSATSTPSLLKALTSLPSKTEAQTAAPKSSIFGGFSVASMPQSGSPFNFGPPAAVSEPTDIPKSSIFGNFNVAPTVSTGFSFGVKPDATGGSASANPPKLFFEAPKNVDDDDSQDDSVEEYEPNVDFKPVIEMPDLVPVQTGEESEEKVFGERAKLFRFDRETREIKERGLGEMKILKNATTGKCRIVMRREQTHKMCANHAITEGMALKPMETCENAWVWHANDYADEELKQEQLCVRFKTKQMADDFKLKFDAAVDGSSGKVVPVSQSSVLTTPKLEHNISHQTPTSVSSSSVTASTPSMVLAKPTLLFSASGLKTPTNAVTPVSQQPLMWSKSSTPLSTPSIFGGNYVPRADDSFKTPSAAPSMPLLFGSATKTPTANMSPIVGGVAKPSIFDLSATPASGNFGASIFSTPQATTAGGSMMNGGASIFGSASKSNVGASVVPATFGFNASGSLGGNSIFASSKNQQSFGDIGGTKIDDRKTVDKSAFMAKPLFGGEDKVNRTVESDNDAEEFEPTAVFKPVIEMPKLVEVKTGEENDEQLFCNVGKLYRYDADLKQWKERGRGNMKILKDSIGKRIRIIMRRDQTQKLCANHYVTPDMKLMPFEMSENAWLWVATDFADEEVKLEKFAIKFKGKDLYEEFHRQFNIGRDFVANSINNQGNVQPNKNLISSNSDKELEIIYKKEATPQQVARARQLLLPDNFYVNEDLPPCSCRYCVYDQQQEDEENSKKFQQYQQQQQQEDDYDDDDYSYVSDEEDDEHVDYLFKEECQLFTKEGVEWKFTGTGELLVTYNSETYCMEVMFYAGESQILRQLISVQTVWFEEGPLALSWKAYDQLQDRRVSQKAQFTDPAIAQELAMVFSEGKKFAAAASCDDPADEFYVDTFDNSQGQSFEE